MTLLALVLLTLTAEPTEVRPEDPPPDVVCSLTQHCTIRLPANERLRSAVLGDPERWIVTAETYGHPEQDFLALRPKKCGIRTRLTLATTRRLHTFNLEGRCDSGDRLNPSTSSVSDLVLVPLAESGAVVHRDPPPPRIPALDHDFHLAADPRLQRRGQVPSVATDDVRTFLTWPGPLSRLPVVRLLRDGESVTLPNPTWSDDLATLTLDTVLEPPDEIVLTFGRLGRKTVTIRRPR